VLQLQAPVLENQAFVDGNFILTVEAPAIARQARPGQFIMAAVARGNELPTPLLKRALAVFTIPDRWSTCSQMTVLVKAVGEGTRKLVAVRPGDQLELVGPLGNGFDLERARSKENILVVGGTGVASVYLLAEDLRRSGESVQVIYGARTRDALVGMDRFSRIGVQVDPVTEDGSVGIKGLVTAGLEQSLARLDHGRCNLYTCGPTRMMQAVASIAELAGIPCQISVEVKMGCGFGVCLGCTVKTVDGHRLACTHGPVFEASKFQWEKSS